MISNINSPTSQTITKPSYKNIINLMIKNLLAFNPAAMVNKIGKN